jgi:hypothetical protein
VPQIAGKIYTVSAHFCEYSRKTEERFEKQIARKSFSGATLETIRKILQTSEKPAFSLSSRVPSTGLSHPSLGRSPTYIRAFNFECRTMCMLLSPARKNLTSSELSSCRVLVRLA